jgi:hypothetical protein
MSLCAICCSTRGPFRREPLGRNDALVNVCAGCDSTPIAKRGPERGYEVPADTISQTEMSAKISAFARAHDPLYSSLPRAGLKTVKDKTPGFLIVRVARRDSMGKTRDYHDAVACLRDKPWFAEARYLGSEDTHFLFERPDPKVATESRGVSANPLAAIEKWRTV